MADEFIVGISLLLGLYFLYKLSKSFSAPSKEYRDEMHDIIHSDKYKVKGRWDE